MKREVPTRHTPGPWQWNLSLSSKRITLQGGKPLFDLTVLDFVRWGMGGAKVRFRCGPDNINIMTAVDLLGVAHPQREHHADWFQLVDHPDARLIEAAPDLLEALEAAVECGMVPKSSAAEGGAVRHSEWVRVADMIRAAIAKAKPKESK